MATSVVIREGWTLEDSFQVTMSRGPTTFVISARFENIENTSWGKAYMRKIGRATSSSPPPDDSGDTSDLVVSLCLPVILELAPIPSIQGLAVDTLTRSPTYHFEIVSAANGQDVRIEGSNRVTYGPSFDIEPVSTTALPNSCARTARMPASDLKLATAEGQADPRAEANVQGRVYSRDGKAMYFKPRFGGREQQLQRELDILGRIAELGLHENPAHRFSRLEGIVTTGDHDDLAIGMLISLISTSAQTGDFLNPAVQVRADMHEKWKAQVVGMVEVLHAHGLVWGDVNAGNVVIDQADNAWVIDFGGLNNPEFVDDDLAETMKGDLQGVERLFGEWLARHRVVDGM